MNNATLRFVCLASAIVSVVILGALQFVPDESLARAFTRLARDGNIENIARLRTFLSNVLLFFGVASSWLWIAFFSRIAIVEDPAHDAHLRLAAALSFGIATLSIIGYLLHRLGLSLPTIYRKEGVLEILSAIFFLLAAVMFARIFWNTIRRRSSRSSSITPLAILLAAACCLFVGMEEISWGQHYLRFDTPSWIESRNHQGELTFHNFMSEDVLDFVTKFVFWMMFAITAFLNLSRRIPAGVFWQEIRPDSNLLGLSLLIAVTATWFHPDPAEFLLALAALYYAKLLAHRLLNDRTTAQAFVQRTPKPSGRM